MRASLLIVIVLIISGCSNPTDETCKKMSDLATSVDKVTYIRNWLVENATTEEFREIFGSHGWVYAIDDQDGFLAIGLDWEWLQINEQSGFVKLHGDFGPKSLYDETKEVSAVTLGQGRSGLLIFMDGFEGARKAFEDGPQGVFQSVSDGVFIFCR